MTPYGEFKEMSKQIGRVNLYLADPLSHMSDSQRHPIDRVNDAALIVFHVFAFEDLCKQYISRLASKKGSPSLNSNLLKKLAWEAAQPSTSQPKRLDEAMPRLRVVDEVMMIRDLCAHGFGRRKPLAVPTRLTPTVLRSYGFETDGREDDLEARWWPTRFCSFSACVAPLMELARWIAENLPVQQ